MKYKVGDKLKYIGQNNWGTTGLNLNQIYTILDITESCYSNSEYSYKITDYPANKIAPFIEDPQCFRRISRSMKLKRILK